MLLRICDTNTEISYDDPYSIFSNRGVVGTGDMPYQAPRQSIFFQVNCTEHEILPAHKNLNAENIKTSLRRCIYHAKMLKCQQL